MDADTERNRNTYTESPNSTSTHANQGDTKLYHINGGPYVSAEDLRAETDPYKKQDKDFSDNVGFTYEPIFKGLPSGHEENSVWKSH